MMLRSFVASLFIVSFVSGAGLAQEAPVASQIIATQLGNLAMSNAQAREDVGKLMQQVSALQKQVEELNAKNAELQKKADAADSARPAPDAPPAQQE